VLVLLSFMGIAAPPQQVAYGSPRTTAEFDVGFAKVNITPSVPFDYLGGDGYERVGTTVENPLYERAIAIAPAGHDGRPSAPPVVLVSVDSQGYFLAYQHGPGGLGVADYGYAQVAAAAAAATGIPPGHVIFSSTHSHTAPDTIGVWGGSPQGYFELVRQAGIKAVEGAVSGMRPAWIRRATADGSAYLYNPIPTAVTNSAAADHHLCPVDGTLTVLQALRWGTTTPLVTLVNFGVHPDILEGTTLISPDWPAWTIAALRADQGGHSLFLQGTLGSEPVLPAGDGHPVEYSGVGTTAGSLVEAQEYGQAIAGLVDGALGHATALHSERVAAATVPIQVPATNPTILALDLLSPPAQVDGALGLGHVLRADTPGYLTGDVVGSVVGVVRIGNGALFDMPGEIFTDVFAAARRQVEAGWEVPVGLADDQLGYVVMPDEWPVLNAAGGVTGPGAEFSLGPAAGSAIVAGVVRAAHEVGFGVRLRPTDLVGSDDPVAAQLEQCLAQGFCAASNTP
ncbi:MAG: hypothetical protein ACYDB3_04715, partial [Acidimicrobiales bacterium]